MMICPNSTGDTKKRKEMNIPWGCFYCLAFVFDMFPRRNEGTGWVRREQKNLARKRKKLIFQQKLEFWLGYGQFNFM
jgi:hypothetical protein